MKPILITAAILMGGILISIQFSNQDPAPVLYGCLLAALVLLPYLLLTLRRERQIKRLLKTGINNPDHLLAHCPDTAQTRDWLAVLHTLDEQNQTQRREQAAQAHAHIEAMTLWTHEIKTPLTALRLLLDQPHPDPVALEAAAVQIEQDVQVALTEAHLAQQNSDFVFTAIDLNALLRDILRRLSPVFIAQSLQVTLEPCTLTVVSDAKWLTFIFEQILLNAIKYTPAGGRITLSVDDHRVTVADTGMGIAPEDLPRITDRGYSGLNGHRHIRATGLGLSMCAQLCDRLNHRLAIDSVVGEGTSVTVDVNDRTLAVD